MFVVILLYSFAEDHKILTMLVQNHQVIDLYVHLEVADLRLHNLPDEILDVNLDVVKHYFSNKAWSAVKKSGTVYYNSLVQVITWDDEVRLMINTTKH